MANAPEVRTLDSAEYLQTLYKQYRNFFMPGYVPQSDEMENFLKLFKYCESFFVEALSKAGILVDFDKDFRGLELRVADRDVNQNLRRLLEHITTARMAEEGDANNYFSILDNNFERSSNQVKELSSRIDIIEQEWLTPESWVSIQEAKQKVSPQGLASAPLSKFDFLVACGQLVRHLSQNQKLQSGRTLESIKFSLAGISERLTDLEKFLSGGKTKELIENALKADVVDIETKSKGLNAKIFGRPAILFGSIIGFLYFLFDYPWLYSYFLQLELPPANGTSAYSYLAPVVVIFLIAGFGNIVRWRRVERIRREIKNQARYLLNHNGKDEWIRTPRNLLDELNGRFGINADESRVETRTRQLKLKRSTDVNTVWNSIRRSFNSATKALVGCTSTVMLSLFITSLGFGNVYYYWGNGNSSGEMVSLIMKAEGRELCLLASGVLYGENERGYFVREGNQNIEISKSAVAKAVFGRKVSDVKDCETVADTFKSVVAQTVTSPAASSATKAAASFHVIQLPVSGGGTNTSTSTTVQPMVTYFIVDGSKVGVTDGEVNGKRTIFLPFFPDDVKKIVDRSDGKKELQRAYEYYLNASASGIDVRRAPGLKEYVAGVREALISCLEEGKVLDIDILGFASITWDHGSNFNTDDLLNHHLAEGRRMAVVREFGFYDESNSANGTGAFRLVQGNQESGVQPPSGKLAFRFGDFEKLKEALRRWYVPPAKMTDRRVQEAMERSVVLSYEENKLRPECRG